MVSSSVLYETFDMCENRIRTPFSMLLSVLVAKQTPIGFIHSRIPFGHGGVSSRLHCVVCLCTEYLAHCDLHVRCISREDDTCRLILSIEKVPCACCPCFIFWPRGLDERETQESLDGIACAGGRCGIGGRGERQRGCCSQEKTESLDHDGACRSQVRSCVVSGRGTSGIIRPFESNNSLSLK